MIKSNLKSGRRPDICCFFKKLKAETAFIFIISTTGIFFKNNKTGINKILQLSLKYIKAISSWLCLAVDEMKRQSVY